MRYTQEELWLEFYEDYYSENKEAELEVEEGDDVTFVTGDSEFDEVEKRLSEGSISDEELENVLSKWEGKPIESIGDGFNDSYGE